MSISPAPAPSDPSPSTDSDNNDWLNQITPSEKKSASEVEAEDDSTSGSFTLFRTFGGAGALLCALIISRLPNAINNYNKSRQEQREQEAARERQRIESMENWKQSLRSQPAANASSTPSPNKPTLPTQPLMPTSNDPTTNKVLNDIQQRIKEDQERLNSRRSEFGLDRPKRQTAAERRKELEEKRKANRPN